MVHPSGVPFFPYLDFCAKILERMGIMGKIRTFIKFVFALWSIIKEYRKWVAVIKSIPWKSIFKKKDKKENETTNKPDSSL